MQSAFDESTVLRFNLFLMYLNLLVVGYNFFITFFFFQYYMFCVIYCNFNESQQNLRIHTKVLIFASNVPLLINTPQSALKHHVLIEIIHTRNYFLNKTCFIFQFVMLPTEFKTDTCTCTSCIMFIFT